jgi:hypothetical protein
MFLSWHYVILVTNVPLVTLVALVINVSLETLVILETNVPLVALVTLVINVSLEALVILGTLGTNVLSLLRFS